MWHSIGISYTEAPLLFDFIQMYIIWADRTATLNPAMAGMERVFFANGFLSFSISPVNEVQRLFIFNSVWKEQKTAGNCSLCYDSAV